MVSGCKKGIQGASDQGDQMVRDELMDAKLLLDLRIDTARDLVDVRMPRLADPPSRLLHPQIQFHIDDLPEQKIIITNRAGSRMAGGGKRGVHGCLYGIVKKFCVAIILI